MAIFNKPEFNSVWATTGTKIDPGVAKIGIGWVVEIPPHEYANWLENRRDAMLAHLNQAGIPAWDSTAEYQANKSYVQGASTGVVYKCLITNTGVNPELDIQGNWEVAFQRSGEALLKSQNLADVPNKAQARVNLGIATTADYDARYLIKSQNLADVPNKATARQQLDVYGKTEVFSKVEIEALFPAGIIEYHASASPLPGRLLANGQAVSRITYSKLFERIGTSFGAGNGTTTFNLPDGRGTFPRGLDLGRGLDGGRTIGSLQLSQNQSHSHTVSDPGHSHNVPGDTKEGYAGGSFDSGNGNIRFYANSTSSLTGISLSTSGGSEARPVNTAWVCFITTGLLT